MHKMVCYDPIGKMGCHTVVEAGVLATEIIGALPVLVSPSESIHIRMLLVEVR